jgi:hypothetical protein
VGTEHRINEQLWGHEEKQLIIASKVHSSGYVGLDQGKGKTVRL